MTAVKTSGSISTGDCLIIEIERGLAKMKEQPQRQLKTVPLTQEHLDSARARLAGRSADRGPGSAPAVAVAPGVIVPTAPASVAKAPPSSVSAMTSAPAAQPAKKSGARGATITVVAIGILAIACAGVAWTSHKNAVVPSAQVNGAAAPASTIVVAQAPAAPAAAPLASETVGFVVAPRAAAGPEGTPSPASDTKVVKAAEPAPVVPAPPTTGAGASPSSPAPATAAEPEAAAKRTSRARPHRTAEPVAKAEPAPVAEPTPKAAPPREAAKPTAPERTSADEKKPAAPAQPASVDAILQQQLKSAIP